MRTLGRLTVVEGLALVGTAPMIIAMSAAVFVVGALDYDRKFGAFSGLSGSEIATRAATIGAAVGIVGTGALGYIAIKS